MSLKAIIFDQDGTLTVPTLDFDKIRADMGITAGPILEAMEHMSPEERQRADEILHEHELEAARNYQLNEGVRETFEFIKSNGIRTALLTRNQLLMVQMLHDLHPFLEFETVITREDEGPTKPDPYPVQKICKTLGVVPADTLVVGDFHFDLLTGKNAGAKTALITTAKNWQTYSHDADYIIHNMHELIPVIQSLI